ncbi:hypothetical protein GF360_02605 [candidate division WWE3 bacterium]|nr:hypothetical protein [candidate division WWE3 bacterium]
MTSLEVQGGIPLNGEVTLSGSAKSAIKILPATLFTTEEVLLENVPQVVHVYALTEILKELGASAEWLEDGRLKLDTSGVDTFRVPYERGLNCHHSLLLVAPLVFRFGRAIVPLPRPSNVAEETLEQLVVTWRGLGMKVSADNEWMRVEMESSKGETLGLDSSDPLVTCNGLLSAAFTEGSTVLTKAAEEAEVDDLLEFLSLLGVEASRTEPRRIEVTGQKLFKGANYKVRNDINECVYFIVAALLTGGTITLKNVDKVALAPFVNVLNKLETNFEFSGTDLTVWHGGEEFKPLEVSAKPAPGVLPDWVPSLALLLTQAHGESVLTSEVPVDWSFVSDFNRLGSGITFLEDSSTEGVSNGSASTAASASDAPKESPLKGIKLSGPSELKGTTIDIKNVISGIPLVIAALAASGKSQIRGYDLIESRYADFTKKLLKLGAKITE